MVKLLLMGVFSVVLSIANIITAPINTLITTYFPDITNNLQQVINIFDTYMISYVAWFVDLIPLNVMSALASYLNLSLTISWFFEPLYDNAIRGLKIAKKLPFM